MVGIISYKNTVLRTFDKEVIEILADLDYLIYGILQFRYSHMDFFFASDLNACILQEIML